MQAVALVKQEACWSPPAKLQDEAAPMVVAWQVAYSCRPVIL
jgi:hypothetical protein